MAVDAPAQRAPTMMASYTILLHFPEMAAVKRSFRNDLILSCRAVISCHSASWETSAMVRISREAFCDLLECISNVADRVKFPRHFTAGLNKTKSRWDCEEIMSFRECVPASSALGFNPGN